MGFIEDLSQSAELFRKIEAGKRLNASETKAFDALKEKYGLSTEGTVKRQQDLADLLGVTRQTIIRWKSEDMPVEPDGSYDPVKVASWRDLVHPDQSQSSPDPDKEAISEDGKKWDSDYRKWKAKLAEVAYQKAIGELIPRADVEQLLTDRAVEFRRALLERSRRLSLRLAGMTAAEIQAALQADAIDMLRAYTRPHQLGQASAAAIQADIEFIEDEDHNG